MTEELRPPPPKHTQPLPPKRRHGPVRRALTSVGGKALRLTGTVAKFGAVFVAANAALHLYEKQTVEKHFGGSIEGNGDNDDDTKDNKDENGKGGKFVLVLPFHSLRLVEKKGPSLDIEGVKSRDKIPAITMEVTELVDIIHAAAADPKICALHADFDEGMRYPMGYAHIEEVRNAIRIFNESHRVHRDPNVGHNPVFAMPRNGEPKSSFAFGHSFDWNQYYLASAFSYVHLQTRGDLHLFGTTVMNTFFGPAFEKYGIKAHVFKHGDYKTAPNIFTEKGYTKAHLETVKSLTASLNNTICTNITNSRALKFDQVMWQSIFEYGSLKSTNSKEIGLVDSAPAVNPLYFLLQANKSKLVEKQKIETKFGPSIAFSRFTASKSITLDSYKKLLDMKRRVKEREEKILSMVKKNSEKSTAMSMIFSSLGLEAESTPSKREKVAVVTVDGAIMNSVSYKVVKSLRRIKRDKDVKCVVLRVNSPGGSVTSSESILEEINALEKPVICSMSNLAASGGYYISTNCEKIFAQPTTLTGSIGIYGIKFDASKWAKSYGIHSDHYPREGHGAVLNPLAPLNPKSKEMLARMTAENYDYFKGIVADGRSLSLGQVEAIAQGRVWTGEQAKEIGLVDELGGLHRAISYAKTVHTSTEDVCLEYWPKKTSILETLSQLMSAQHSLIDALHSFTVKGIELRNMCGSTDVLLKGLDDVEFAKKMHIMATMDERTALDLILSGE
mmetsp:Transcript_15936/g.31781  ORF Transcript_15936/g.31781 Transcript_15936/m.31781 type:complete len:729 (+) Transcript_15936:109-2295(+)